MGKERRVAPSVVVINLEILEKGQILCNRGLVTGVQSLYLRQGYRLFNEMLKIQQAFQYLQTC